MSIVDIMEIIGLLISISGASTVISGASSGLNTSNHDSENQIVSNLSMSTGLTGISIGLVSYGMFNHIHQLETTRAYIESLNKEQLQEFAAKLELKNQELSTEKVKIKTLHR